ncbi:hypothetical protein [Modestobacter marinus]|uniref:hypothetical protein n=1 Tax=Modestobacter marinus TaxID=477641 RepID=UPI001C9499E8|nr:hypothetical protein [Modestobacter marinus]
MSAEGSRPLWPDRYLTDGRLVITPPPDRSPGPESPLWEQARDWLVAQEWLVWCGRQWRALDTDQKWVLAVLLLMFTGGLGLLVPAAGVLVVQHRENAARAALPAHPVSPEASLAAWDTIEARVAGAASRAWAETVREPSWHSPYLAATRTAFDGDAEVRQIVDLASRIRQARSRLGLRPTGPAAEFWDRQQTALDDAARRLGHRADALIRHRDQAAALSVELQHLADLERMERSAVEVDGLTVETAYPSGRGDGGLGDVAERIAAVRGAMTDLVDLMTRTRAPLAEPPDVPR